MENPLKFFERRRQERALERQQEKLKMSSTGEIVTENERKDELERKDSNPKLPEQQQM